MGSRSAGRPVADEADARACLDAQRASGLTLFEWARTNGVSGQSLYRWRQVIAGRDGRGIAEETEARRLLAGWRKSGRSFAEWCRKESVSMDALSQWRRKLDAPVAVGRSDRQKRSRAPTTASPQPSSIRLIEVALSSGVPQAAAPAEESTAARYAVCMGRCRVLLGTDFDDAVLTRLLRVAAACGRSRPPSESS